jgi:hypothetical protein
MLQAFILERQIIKNERPEPADPLFSKTARHPETEQPSACHPDARQSHLPGRTPRRCLENGERARPISNRVLQRRYEKVQLVHFGGHRNLRDKELKFLTGLTEATRADGRIHAIFQSTGTMP